MIRVLIVVAVLLSLPYAVWKAWRLFGPAAEIKEPPGPGGGTGAEPPWLLLAAIGVALVALTLTYLVLTSEGVPAQ